jgi:hypothetical protein
MRISHDPKNANEGLRGVQIEAREAIFHKPAYAAF